VSANILAMFVGIPDHHLDGCSSSDLNANKAKKYITSRDLLSDILDDNSDYYDNQVYQFGTSGRTAHMQLYRGFLEAKSVIYINIEWSLGDLNLNILVGLDEDKLRVICVPTSSVYKIYSAFLVGEERFKWYINGRSIYSKPYWIWEKAETPVLPGRPVLPPGYLWTPCEQNQEQR
jgi:hypothetical protein